MRWIVTLLLVGTSTICLGQRGPPLPQQFPNNFNNPSQAQNASSVGIGGVSMQVLQQQQKNEELANIKDENIKKVLQELSTLQTPSQTSDTMTKVATLIGPLFINNFDTRKDEILAQNRDSPEFPQRLLSAVTDIQGEEVKALVLQKKLDLLHAADFAFLPLAIQYGFTDEIFSNLSGTKLASVVKVNPGDTVIAFKASSALVNQPEQQIDFLQSLGAKLLPQVQRIIMSRLLDWWGDPHGWKDRELTLLTSAGSPLLAYMPQSQLQSLDDELADRFVTILGQTQDVARTWWRKPMSLKKSWFDVAKGARYFGAVHEWSFRRMQKLSFLLEGASPEDLELIPSVPEIKGLVIGNHYTELQARIVFDAFYRNPPLSQEDLQEFQFHVLDLIPAQLQRFDFADSFGTLDEMMSILDRQPDPSYPTVLQISYFMWPIVNSTNSVMAIAPPATWQKRELSQIGKMFFLLPKTVLSQIKQGIINWDSNTLSAIRSNHLTQYQVWKLTSQILLTVDERFKPDYIFMIPSPYQKGIPSHNISQALLGSTTVRPEILRSLIEQASGMLVSQQAVILQRIINRIGESIIVRTMVGTSNPATLFKLISPKVLSKNMATIIKTIMEMPETGRFGITSIQTKLLPHNLLSLWLKWVRENGQVSRWTAEDLLGRSSLGATHELNLAILGLSCRDIEIVDHWDILSVIMHYRHELYALRRFKSSLKFNVNLRTCVLEKIIQYLKQKRFLSGNQTDGQILTGITLGETEAIGGEILSIIPTTILDQLDMDSRQNIVKEIGQLQMQELFSLISLDNLHWYGKTLFRDISINTIHGINVSSERRRRQAPTEADISSKNDGQGVKNPTTAAGVDATSSTEVTGDASSTIRLNSTRSTEDSVSETAGTTITDSTVLTVPPASTSQQPVAPPKRGIDLESLTSMGNLLCYADNLFEANWPRSLLKDVLEAKTSIGEKTCCLHKLLRDKWFETLKAVYGSDTSSWNEFDINSIGDLLIVLPEQDLKKISTDSLGKAVTPLMRQSAWATQISIPGKIKKVQFVTACTEALGTEGQEFMMIYKNLMKRLFQASQWMVNTVKTTQELIRDGVGRTGRIPRWAEHTLVKRQIPMSLAGGELSYSGAAPTTTTVIYPTTAPAYAVQPQGNIGYVAYAPQYGTPMVTGYGMPQHQVMYNVQPSAQQQFYYTQPMMPGQPGGQVISVIGTGGQTVVGGSGAVAGAAAGTGTAAAAAGGGSFSSSGSLAQTTANSANANAFAQGGSFSQGSDQAQNTGGTFSQANANANTLAARSTVNNQQQQAAAVQSTGNSPSPTQLQPANPSGLPQSSTPVLTQPQPAQGGGPPAQPQGATQPNPPQNLNPSGQPQITNPSSPPQGGNPVQSQSQGGSNPGQLQSGQPQPSKTGPPPVAIPPVQPPQGPIPQVNSVGSNLQQPQPAQNAAGAAVGAGRSGGSSSNPQDLRARSLPVGTLQDDTHTSEITCHGIKASASAAIGLSIDDLNKLSQADLFDCVEALGKIEWDDDIKGQIMTLLKQKLEFNKDSINSLTLIELGDLVTAFSANPADGASNTTAAANDTVHSDISMIDLTLPDSLDMLAVLGSQTVDPALLKSLAEKFNQDNKIFPGFSEGIARPENLRIVVMSLGNILCGLNNKIVNSIFETDASLFIDTSRGLGKLEGCGNEVLSTLAAHAVRPSNYGPPRLWSQEDVETIGVVFAGLKPDAISTIPADAMQGLTPLAVKNLPAPSILAFTPEQLSKISYSAAMAFTPAQSHNFSPPEADALKAVVQVKLELFSGPSVDQTVTPVILPPVVEAPQDDLAVRGLEKDQEGPGIGGRSRDFKIETEPSPPHVTTEATTTEAPTTTPPPPTTEAPKTSSSSSKVASTWNLNYYLVTLIAMIIPVMNTINI